MSNPKHLEILMQGVPTWNRRRAEDHDAAEALDAALEGATIDGDIPEVLGLDRPDLVGADLGGMNLSGVNFHKASLTFANLNGANLSGADLSEADLRAAYLLKTDLSNAILTDCAIWGVAAWGVTLNGTIQKNLKIAHEDDPTITVDDIEIAQFIYLLLNNNRIRNFIDTVAAKAVLILGRFTPERKLVLDALRETLRRHDYVPIVFDFDKPASRNLGETVSTLAHLSRFVIADITAASSLPQELQRIIPSLPSVPVQPLILSSEDPYSMFKDFEDYSSVLPLYRYDSVATLLASIEQVIAPAMEKAQEIAERRRNKQ